MQERLLQALLERIGPGKTDGQSARYHRRRCVRSGAMDP